MASNNNALHIENMQEKSFLSKVDQITAIMHPKNNIETTGLKLAR